MNRIEQVADRLPGQVSVRLRLLKKRLHRDRMLTVMREHVRLGDHVVDIGANRGVYSLFLSALVGPAGKVEAIDPFPINAASVTAATRARSNVAVHCLALSDRRSQALLHVPVHQGRRVDALATLGPPPPVEHDSVPVDVARLDDLLGDAADDVRFVKCDVEGHEPAVLRGATRTLASRPVLVIEIEQRHHPDLPIADVFDQLAGLGYRGHAMFGDGPRPLEAFDVERDQLAFLTGSFEAGGMPDGYVSDFVFVPAGSEDQ